MTKRLRLTKTEWEAIIYALAGKDPWTDEPSIYDRCATAIDKIFDARKG